VTRQAVMTIVVVMGVVRVRGPQKSKAPALPPGL